MTYPKMILNIVIISLTFFIICSLSESKKLKLVFVVHRHGDRTPVFGWPSNPYNDSKKYWPDGLGMLTNKGKQRMHSLGKYIRKRYKNFLTDNPREVYARSSEKERCLESVSLLLAGLYPPANRWKWDNDLGRVWQPFPIHTMNISHDGLLCPEAICRSAEKESQRVMRSEAVKEFLKKNEDLVHLIEEKTGVIFKNYQVGRDLWSSLEIHKLDGLKLPEWVNTTVYTNIRLLSDMAFTFDSSTYLLHRMRAGASVFLELYEFDNRYEIELHYLNDTTSEKPYRLPFTCGHSDQSVCDTYTQNNTCPLDQFIEAVKSLIPSDWEEECKHLKSNFKISAKIEL